MELTGAKRHRQLEPRRPSLHQHQLDYAGARAVVGMAALLTLGGTWITSLLYCAHLCIYCLSCEEAEAPAQGVGRQVGDISDIFPFL